MSSSNVIYLSAYIKDLRKDLDAAEWDGYKEKAEHLQKLLDEATDMEARGEQYYPLF